jgi:adenylylsulfate kinase
MAGASPVRVDRTALDAARVVEANSTPGASGRPCTLWFTGLSGAGKSTLAGEVARQLLGRGQAAHVLDGDVLRKGLSSDLGFGPDDRRENVRRVAEVCRLMNDAGLIVVAALISPSSGDRTMARRIIGRESFVEVYLDADLAICEQRDPKGLYARARAGAIAEFTGVSAPYDVPSAPDLVVRTGNDPVERCVDQLLSHLDDRHRLARLGA